MFNRKFGFMFCILAAAIALSLFMLSSHKAGAQQNFNSVLLVNDTDERVCAVMMTYTAPFWITRGWYCIGSNQNYPVNITVNSDRVYFYATSPSRIWSEYWDRTADLPPNNGFPAVIDTVNAFNYSFAETDNKLSNAQNNINAGFDNCGSRVTNDCRSVALMRTTGQSRNNALVVTFSRITSRTRGMVTEY